MNLPELFKLDGFYKNQGECLKKLHDFYREEIVNAGLVFFGYPLSFQSRPEINGMQNSFYHLISEGGFEVEEREINFKRCQRIPWIPYVIKNSDNSSMIKCWENTRNNSKHTVLWLHEHNYLVVLAKRTGYHLLKTAYPIELSHKVNKLNKESQMYPDPRKS